MLELWLVLAVVDMMSWGVGQVLVKRATDRLGAVTMVLFVTLVDGALYLAVFLAAGQSLAASASTYAVAALTSAVGITGYILYFEALLRGNISVVATITAGSPIITILGAIAFLNEPPTLAQAAGMALLVAVILILSYEPLGEEWKVPVAVTLSVAILVLWGIWGILTKVAVTAPGFGPWQLLLFYSLSNFVAGVPYYVWRRKRFPPPNPSRRAYALGAGGFLLMMGGIVASTVARSLGDASLVTAVGGCAPVVTSLVAFAFLRENATPLRILAILLFLPGILLVAF
ncbi:MAG TPA: DMT family transporter [Thermoplasmata archaeon]|nr:DMT family transporter [Thermoplasmata archaeon]